MLIVDDAPENLQVLMETLKDEYTIVAAIDGQKALSMAALEPVPDLVLLDVLMPGMDGYEVCSRLKADERTRDIPVVFITMLSEEEEEARGLDLGAVDYITKPFRPRLVKARVRNHLELKGHRDHLEELVQERTRDLAHTQEVTIHSLAVLAETRDNETGGHIMRTQHYVRALSEYLARHPEFCDVLDNDTVDLLYTSAPLHDIGKVGVRDHILLKPGRLTSGEFEEMKKHTLYGRDAILKAEEALGGDRSTSFLRFAREITYTHHEKWDGSGYPEGLAGQDIPLSGRLMMLADVYDALITKRVYKLPFSHEKAVHLIAKGDGRTMPAHFDPDVLDAFLELEGVFRQIALEFADVEEERSRRGGSAAEDR